MAFLAGLFGGIIAGICIAAYMEREDFNRARRSGYVEFDGTMYRLVPMQNEIKTE